jgi:D-psicose/D-tagatose/L-ribulose 3-epimerase
LLVGDLLLNLLGVHTFAVASEWQNEIMGRVLPRLHELGVRLVEIPLLRPDELDAPGARKLAEQNGMELVCSLGLPGRISVVERPDEAVDFLSQALEVTARAGASNLSGVPYGTLGYTSGKPRSEKEVDAICKLLERAARVGRERGLSLGIEPCNRYETHLLNRAADARQLIERIGAENLFIHLDTYHMNIEEESFAAGFSAAGRHLGYVHLSESHRGIPGRGMINWPDVMTALVRIGYGGPVVLESFNYLHPDIASGLAVWHPVADDPDSVISEGLPFLAAAATDAGLVLKR